MNPSSSWNQNVTMRDESIEFPERIQTMRDESIMVSDSFLVAGSKRHCRVNPVRPKTLAARRGFRKHAVASGQQCSLPGSHVISRPYASRYPTAGSSGYNFAWKVGLFLLLHSRLGKRPALCGPHDRHPGGHRKPTSYGGQSVGPAKSLVRSSHCFSGGSQTQSRANGGLKASKDPSSRKSSPGQSPAKPLGRPGHRWVYGTIAQPH